MRTPVRFHRQLNAFEFFPGKERSGSLLPLAHQFPHCKASLSAGNSGDRIERQITSKLQTYRLCDPQPVPYGRLVPDDASFTCEHTLSQAL